MVELFKHLMPLDFKWIMLNYGTIIYIVLFLVIFIETGLVAMPFLPGDSLLFMAGLFARSGELNLAYLFLLLFIAAVLGDNCNYWIGRKIGINIFNLKFKGKPLVKKEYLEKTHIFFEKHGTKAIIMARFVPFVRTFAPFAAGIGHMSYTRYVLFCIAGAMLWVPLLSLAGYYFGNIPLVKKNFEIVIFSIIFISLLPMIIAYFKSKFAKT
jgi:membrane-associated protein